MRHSRYRFRTGARSFRRSHGRRSFLLGFVALAVLFGILGLRLRRQHARPSDTMPASAPGRAAEPTWPNSARPERPWRVTASDRNG